MNEASPRDKFHVFILRDPCGREFDEWWTPTRYQAVHRWDYTHDCGAVRCRHRPNVRHAIRTRSQIDALDWSEEPDEKSAEERGFEPVKRSRR